MDKEKLTRTDVSDEDIEELKKFREHVGKVETNNDYYSPTKEHGVTVTALGFGNTHKQIQFDTKEYEISNIDVKTGMITLEKIQNTEKK